MATTALDVLSEQSLTPSQSQLSAMSRLFSATVLREMAAKGKSALFARLVVQLQTGTDCSDQATVGDVFNAAFSVLRTVGLRDEYIYRAALTHKILLGKHSLNTASMLSEFRVGACKADLVILNGTATVFEIKSERDSLSRLANQVENYKRVFASVNVIAGDSHIRSVLQTIPADVGVMCLSRRYQITTVREAHERPDRICPVTAFESLRSAEAREILKNLCIDIPKVSDRLYHGTMRELFSTLHPEDVHHAMVKVLKRTRDLAPLSELVERLPASLHAAALTIRFRRRDHERLVRALATPLETAMAWA